MRLYSSHVKLWYITDSWCKKRTKSSDWMKIIIFYDRKYVIFYSFSLSLFFYCRKFKSLTRDASLSLYLCKAFWVKSIETHRILAFLKTRAFKFNKLNRHKSKFFSFYCNVFSSVVCFKHIYITLYNKTYDIINIYLHLILLPKFFLI